MLKDKIIFVAGANGRIGLALCEEILKLGGICIMADINEAKVKENAKSLSEKFKQDLLALSLDISDQTSLDEAVKKSVAKYKKIDSFVNCAYPLVKNARRKEYYEATFDEICQDLNAHLAAFIFASNHFIKFFKKQGYGNIINLSSIMGVYAPKFENYKGTNMQSSLEYSVIKAGINHLTRWCAKELFGTKVRINALASGGIKDNQPQSFLTAYQNCCASKGMLESADVCGAICFLCSEYANFITGQVLVVDDGWGL